MAGFSNVDSKTIANYTFLAGGLPNFAAPAAAALPPLAPAVTIISPANGGVVSSTTLIQLSATGPQNLVRVVMLVSFPNLNIYEVAHDGDSFSGRYPAALGNTRSATTTPNPGFTFSLLRQGGWPASPRIIPCAFDAFGQLNPISSVIYAWTLV